MAVTSPAEVVVPAPAGHRKLRRAAIATLVLLHVAGLAVGAAALAWYAYGLAYEGRVFAGVTVGGVDLSGMDAAQAEAALAPVMADRFGGEATVTVDGRTFSAPYAELGRTPDVAATVAAAMAVGRGVDLETQLRERLAVVSGGVAVEPALAYDAAATEAWVESIGRQLDVPPVEATVSLSRKGVRATPDVLGARFDRASVAKPLRALLAEPGTGPASVLEGALLAEPARLTDIEAAMTVAAVRRVARPLKVVYGEELSWTLKPYRVREWLDLVPERSGWAVRLDVAALRRTLPKSFATKTKRAPLETTFLVTRAGKRVGFVAGRPGRQLDREKTIGRMLGTLQARFEGSAGGEVPVELATKSVGLKLTAEEAGKIVPEMVRISSWTTYYQVSERNGFSANITIPARLINGTYLQPGQAFDFWGAVGPVTYARGFRDGAIIVGGRSQPTGAIAGGICSASTTLFNAAARAGLQILERDNHYYYISRYPLGLDATVSKSRGRIVQNMRFRNDTPHPIFIRGAGGPGWVTFEMFSIADTRTTTFSKPKVWGVVPAGDYTVRTSALPRGTSKRLEYPVQGMNVLVTRTVKDQHGRVVHRDDFYTNYGKVDGLLQIGTG